MKYFYKFKRIEFDINGDGQTQTMTDFFRHTRINPKLLDNVLYYTYYDIKNGERPDIVSNKLYKSINYHWTFGLVNPHLVDIRKDWPMSAEEIAIHTSEKYPGYCIIIKDISLATTFSIGETVQGLASGALGIITEKDVNLGYIRVSVTSGSFQSGELLYGSLTNQYLTIDAVREFIYAPHHYQLTDGTIVDRFVLGAQEITNYDYELEKNDRNARIRIIRPEYIQQVANMFYDLVK